MALTTGQKTWLDSQVGKRRALTAEGTRTGFVLDGRDHVYTVELDLGGEVKQRWVHPAKPRDPQAEVGTRAAVGVEGEVAAWRENADGTVDLHVVVSNGDNAWERLDAAPRSEAELEAERKSNAAAAAKAQQARQVVLDRITAARAKGANRTAAETAALIDDLAGLLVTQPGSPNQPTPPTPPR